MNVSHDFKYVMTSYVGLPRFSEKLLSCLFLESLMPSKVIEEGWHGDRVLCLFVCLFV